jgi:hypothetical protein
MAAVFGTITLVLTGGMIVLPRYLIRLGVARNA